MLEMSPLGVLTWWEASCEWGKIALEQSESTFEAVPDNNYRFYFGTGSQHTMYGNNKVYRDTAGGVPTVVDWIDAMLKSRPGAPTRLDQPGMSRLQPVLEGTMGDDSDNPDPRPGPELLVPFEQQGNDVVINCPPPQ